MQVKMNPQLDLKNIATKTKVISSTTIGALDQD
jgi:hypothetical protein